MKTISANFKTHLAQSVTTLALCLYVKRVDGTEEGYTNNNTDLEVDSFTYVAASGMSMTAVQESTNLVGSNMEITTLLDDDMFQSADINAGLYDNAEVIYFLTNFESPADGKLILLKGTFGNIRTTINNCIIEIRSNIHLLDQGLTQPYSFLCRATLGDTKCGVNVPASYTDTGTVTTLGSNLDFYSTSLTASTNYYQFGKLTWTSGNNNGLSVYVSAFNTSPSHVFFKRPFPGTIQIGDEFQITAGCDKHVKTCGTKFSNIINFRGEPFIPSPSNVFNFPDVV